MSTPAQSAANLANSHLSTGPKTEEGKAASSQNSLKHGLTAKTVLLPGEDPAKYQALAQGMTTDLAPGNTVESSLVTELVDLQWRLQRVPRLEATILSFDVPDFKALNNISLHAARIKRQFSASLKELRQLQAVRKEQQEAAMEQAVILRRADVILKRPTDLAQFGFVFTVHEVDRHIHLADAFTAAKGPSPTPAGPSERPTTLSCAPPKRNPMFIVCRALAGVSPRTARSSIDGEAVNAECAATTAQGGAVTAGLAPGSVSGREKLRTRNEGRVAGSGRREPK